MPNRSEPANPYYQGPPSDHFDGTRFFNPGDLPTAGRSFGRLLRWRMFGPREPWTIAAPVATAHPAAREDGLRVTMVGHATLLIQLAGCNLLTDPVWSARASPFRHLGPARATPPGVAFDDLPPIDAVLLSHNHYDHCDTRTLSRLYRRDHPRIITPLGNDTILRRADQALAAEAYDWNDRVTLGDRVTVTLVPANHWSARGFRDGRMALWCGFVVTSDAATVYFAGDTGYRDGRLFATLGERHGPLDLAILPIGAYEPRAMMHRSHINPAEAVRILQSTGAAHAIGMHWGTFRLSDEAREAPVADLHAALDAAGLPRDRFITLTPGQSWP